LVPDLHLTHSRYILSRANGTDLPVLGDTDLHFTIDGEKSVANICVSPAVEEFLLGGDWLVNNKCKWDFAEGTINVGNRLIRVHQCTASDVCRCILVTENYDMRLTY